MNQKTHYKKGLLDYLALWYPLSFLYTVGTYYTNLARPLKYGFLQYRKFCNFLKESQWWPKEKLEEYQVERLRTLIQYAYENVPYYQGIFKERKLKPEDIKSVNDLKKLPILTKEGVINNFDGLISKKAQKKHLVLDHTSGSSGKPMAVYSDKRFKFINRGFLAWYLTLGNVNMYDRYIRLWSRPFIERNLRADYLHEPYEGRLSLSTVPKTMDKFGEYIRLIKEFRPVYAKGSPSFLYQLASYAQEADDDSVGFRVFFSQYENLYHYQRALIQKQFHCDVLNYYSSEEGLIYAIECNKHEGMHIEIRKGAMEIVGQDEEVLENGQQGRIICTGFDNYVMPLIRYDMGDIGSISSRQCSCGRGLPLLKSLDGRSSEVIKYKGKTIYPATLSLILERLSNIKECQFVQNKEDEIEINIVKRKNYSSYDTDELMKSLKYLIGTDFNAKVDFIDTIPRTKMGKFKFVINHLITQETM